MGIILLRSLPATTHVFRRVDEQRLTVPPLHTPPSLSTPGLEDINEIFVGEERGWTMIDKVMTLNKKSEDSEPKASRRFGVQVVYSWEVKREGIMGAIASSAARVVGGDFISNPLKGFKRMFDWVPGTPKFRRLALPPP